MQIRDRGRWWKSWSTAIINICLSVCTVILDPSMHQNPWRLCSSICVLHDRYPSQHGTVTHETSIFSGRSTAPGKCFLAWFVWFVDCTSRTSESRVASDGNASLITTEFASRWDGVRLVFEIKRERKVACAWRSKKEQADVGMSWTSVSLSMKLQKLMLEEHLDETQRRRVECVWERERDIKVDQKRLGS